MRRTSIHVVLVFCLFLVAAVSAGSAGSAGSAPPGQSAPVNLSPPSLSGGAVVGQSLSAGVGSWGGPTVSFAFQWLRCDAGGGGCGAIAGAGGSSYLLGAAEVGGTVRVTVTAA